MEKKEKEMKIKFKEKDNVLQFEEDYKVDILGTEYAIKSKSVKDCPYLNDVDGFADYTTKEIVIARFKIENDSFGNLASYMKKCIRHEIIHSFLAESGLTHNSLESKSWAMNEEMVDYFAHQTPRMFKVFEELGVLE